MLKNILIIDDEAGIRDMFKFMLEPYPLRVTTADSGPAGLELLKKTDFDVVFLDVHMPQMGGRETLIKIKELKPEQIVVISSSSSDVNYQFETEAKELGAHSCLYKPAEISEILATLEDIFGKFT